MRTYISLCIFIERQGSDKLLMSCNVLCKTVIASIGVTGPAVIDVNLGSAPARVQTYYCFTVRA